MVAKKISASAEVKPNKLRYSVHCRVKGKLEVVEPVDADSGDDAALQVSLSRAGATVHGVHIYKQA